LLSSVDRMGGTTSYAYDPVGNLVTLTDAEGQITQFEYDGRNRRVRTYWPDHVSGAEWGNANMGLTEVNRDALGRPVRLIQQDGASTTLNFDRAGRLVSREYRRLEDGMIGPVAGSESLVYDNASRLVSASSSLYSNLVTFEYDDAGRVVSESLVIGDRTYTLGYAYNSVGKLAQIVYPDGSTVVRNFTPRGRLQDIDYDPDGVGPLNSRRIAEILYDAGGREAERWHHNGLVTTLHYVQGCDLLQRREVQGRPDLSFSYSYEANGNVFTETLFGQMSDYSRMATYDAEDRLVVWQRSDANTQNWDLSTVGDWRHFTANGVTQSRVYASAHELASIDVSDVTHDVRGNVTCDAVGRALVWDFANRLTSATIPAGCPNAIAGTHTYTYDALGRRVSKTVDGGATGVTTSVFLSQTVLMPNSASEGQVLAEYVENANPGGPIRKWIYGETVDAPILLANGPPSNEQQLAYHADRMDSTVALTEANGNAVERYVYTPYGETTVLAEDGVTTRSASGVGNAVCYEGRTFDSETGFYHFRARYLSAQHGAFLSRDPLPYRDCASLYAFVGNRPTRDRDPSGKSAAQTPAGVVAPGKVCAVTMLENGVVPQAFKDEAAVAADDEYTLQGATGTQQILDWLSKKDCCTVYFIGHAGVPAGTPSGGMTTYLQGTDVPSYGKPVKILPDDDFEKKMGALFKQKKCQHCAVNVVACGSATAWKVHQGIANDTGCLVCGSHKQEELGWGILNGGPIIGLDGKPINWDYKCQPPPGGGWEWKCVSGHWSIHPTYGGSYICDKYDWVPK